MFKENNLAPFVLWFLRHKEERFGANGFFNIAGLLAAPAVAETQEFIVTSREQQLAQVLGGYGESLPEGCRNVTISVLERNCDRLCLVDLSDAAEGFVPELGKAAVERRWWMRCQDIEAAVR